MVLEDSRLRGILTDRDIVVRVVAGGLPADRTTVGEICSTLRDEFGTYDAQRA